MSGFLLEMKNITKTFPGVKALDNVNLNVRAGTVHALMGENGAGKSTLMKCLFGIYNPDGGEQKGKYSFGTSGNGSGHSNGASGTSPDKIQIRYGKCLSWKIPRSYGSC